MSDEMNLAGAQSVDITPSPRVLRVFGEIPFQVWQCFAELMDNSIDALLGMQTPDDYQRAVWVSWAKESVAENSRTIEISDNATGMTLEQMQNAVRAGYSSNNPMDNLGLFGMGFNIATARLGERTEIWSTVEDSDKWYGISIDFNVLARAGNFQAPVLSREKQPGDTTGTTIIVSHLRDGVSASLYNQERDIRKTLENIYAPLLSENKIDLYVQGKILHPKRPCVWSAERSVVYKGIKVPAYIEIDEQLGGALFDMERNVYLSLDEQDQYSGVSETDLPENICVREKRLHGWLAIQRYSDTNDYGIDFIRNGRKILIRDKSLFTFQNPITGETALQYPVELGSTVGGRIVGQLHVDYLLPTYQKNDFDRYDTTWYETMNVLRGQGPFLPRSRKALNLDEVPDTPLGLLVNAYRRSDAGTKNLVVPRQTAKEYLRAFNRGDEEYQSDELWWKAAQEHDQQQQSGNNPPSVTTDEPSDDIESYLIGGSQQNSSGSQPQQPQQPKPTSIPETSESDELIQRAKKITSLSHQYKIGSSNPLTADVYELENGAIYRDGKKVPCFFQPIGMSCVFVYDSHDPLFQQYPVTATEMLLLNLAERFKTRDGISLADGYTSLVSTYMADERVDASSLSEKAENFFAHIREPMKELLAPVSVDAVKCIHESTGEVEEALTSAVNAGISFNRLRVDSPTAYEIFDYVPYKTLIRLIDRFPEQVLDGKLFDYSYSEILFTDKQAEERLKESVKDRLMSYIKDILYLLTAPKSSVSKNELNRIALSLDVLNSKMVRK